jgi:ribosomal protein S18 acetylase RimI-like enzyme
MQLGTRVWIYRLEDGTTVGFGSLGKTRWTWPEGEEPANPELSIIPALAIAMAFQGGPQAGTGERFSTQIMDHLVAEAYRDDTDYLVLEVHCQNARALKLYESYSFTMSRRAHIKHFDGVDHVYRAMFLKKR